MLCRPVQPSDNGGGVISPDFGHFQGLKIRVPSGCLRDTSICKILMIDDVTQYFVVKAGIHNVKFKSTRFY